MTSDRPLLSDSGFLPFPVMTTEEIRVYDELSRHRGRHRAIPNETLAEILMMNERRMRAVLRGLVVRHGIPVCSTPAGGVYFGVLPSELREAAQAILRPAKAMFYRAHKLLGVPYGELMGMMELEQQESSQPPGANSQEKI